MSIREANQECLRRILASQAVWVSMAPARDVVPGMADHVVYHAGPPITWERMCGPMKGAIIGACLFEGWARSREEAAELGASGDLTFSPGHEHRCLGPMSGIITPSMAVHVVRNEPFGIETYTTIHMGSGKVLRHGANDDDVLDRLKWMNSELAEILATAVRRSGGIDIKHLIAEALQMGDEVHNRNRASSALLIRDLAPHIVTAAKGNLERAFQFMGNNASFALNAIMAACKAMLDAGNGVPESTIVTTMARNGTEFGIRVSGLNDRWFVAPSPRIDGVYFPGYGPQDANPDLGDSAITETMGLGSFAMAAAPAIVQLVGGSPRLAMERTMRMYEITAGENNMFRIPALDFRGTALGIDIRKVVQTGICPAISTGIAHKNAGVGQIGAGLTAAPMECFTIALEAFAAKRKTAGVNAR